MEMGSSHTCDCCPQLFCVCACKVYSSVWTVWEQTDIMYSMCVYVCVTAYKCYCNIDVDELDESFMFNMNVRTESRQPIKSQQRARSPTWVWISTDRTYHCILAFVRHTFFCCCSQKMIKKQVYVTSPFLCGRERDCWIRGAQRWGGAVEQMWDSDVEKKVKNQKGKKHREERGENELKNI